MNNREAIAIALVALEQRGTFAVDRRKARASRQAEDQPAAAADAEAWNTLTLLAKVI